MNLDCWSQLLLININTENPATSFSFVKEHFKPVPKISRPPAHMYINPVLILKATMSQVIIIKFVGEKKNNEEIHRSI